MNNKLNIQISTYHKYKKTILATATVLAIGIAIAIGAPQLRLVGVHNDSLAIIEDVEKGTQDLFEVGGEVFTEGQLVEVTATHVVVRQGNEETRLPLKAGVSVAQTLEEMAIAVPNLFRDSKEFSRVPHGFLSAKTAPVVRNEQLVGFTVNEVAQGSLLEKWGLAQNDVVSAVNGTAVPGVYEALDAIRKSDGKSISIEIERNGVKQNITVG